MEHHCPKSNDDRGGDDGDDDSNDHGGRVTFHVGVVKEQAYRIIFLQYSNYSILVA